MTLSRIKYFFTSLSKPAPRRDWFLSLVALSLLFVALALFAAFFFFSIQSGTAFSNIPESTPRIPVTRTDIWNLLNDYQARQVNYAAHNFPAPPLIDPGK